MPLTWLNVGFLINFISAFIIGAFVFIKNRKAEVNKAFFGMCLCISLWALGFFFMTYTKDRSFALFHARFLNASALFISVTYLHFILAVLQETGRQRKLLVLCYGINALLLFFIILMPEKFIGDVAFKLSKMPDLYAEDKLGILFHIYTAIFCLYALYPFYLLFRTWGRLSGNRGTQIRFILIASIIGFIGGGSSFLVTYGVFDTIDATPTSALWTFILGYSIIRYRTFEIDTVIHRTVLWVFTSALIFIPIGVVVYFLRPYYGRLGVIELTLINTALFFMYLYYYNRIQPRIDRFFRRRKYNYQVILASMAEKFATVMDPEDLVRQLLSDICGIMNLRNSSLYILAAHGRSFYLAGKAVSDPARSPGAKTRAEVFPEKGEAGPGVLPGTDPVADWILLHQEILEKDQVELNPQFEKMKNAVLDWLKSNELELIVPIVFKDKVNALLGLGKKQSLQSYRMKDLQVLKKLGEETGVIIYNALHYRSLVEVERLEEEMRTGRQIQLALLPQEVPAVKGLSIRGFMEPAKEIGGDYYDFFNFPENDRLAVVIGDVSGKGIGAGLLMSMVKAAMHMLSRKIITPREVLLEVNQLLTRYLKGDKFMTLLYLLWQAGTSTLRYSSAGHEHILHYRKKEHAVEAIPSGGTMLGIMPDVGPYLEEKELALKNGDKILLYTDGVTEAHNEEKDRFGLERLKSSFLANIAQPVPELLRAVRDDVYAFIGAAPQYDDVTLVVLEAV